MQRLYGAIIPPGPTSGARRRARWCCVNGCWPRCANSILIFQREALQQASDALTRDRSALSPVEANREVYQLLKEGVKVLAWLNGFKLSEVKVGMKAKLVAAVSPEGNATYEFVRP